MDAEKKTLCLLVHGYLGTPDEMLPLCEPLEALGLDTRLVTLPGHDSTVEEFRRTYFKDWEAHVLQEYTKALEEYARVILIGFSLGGALVLRAAQYRSPFALVTLAAPVFPTYAWPMQLRDWGLLFLPFIRLFKKEVPLRPWRPESRKIAPWRGYEGVAYPAQIYSMFKGFNNVRGGLGAISCPILLIHDMQDRVVNSANSLAIVAGIQGDDYEFFFTKIKEKITSHHTLTTHQEVKEAIKARLYSFIAAKCGLAVAANV